MRVSRLLLLLAVLAAPLPAALAQPTTGAPTGQAAGPPRFKVLGVTVEGATSDAVRAVVSSASGLRVGQELLVPGDPQIADAVRAVYRLGQFSDVRVVEDRRVGDGVFLTIQVTESPRISDYTIDGAEKKDRDAIRTRLPFVKGARLTQSDLQRAESVVEDYFQSKGYLLADASVTTAPATDGGVNVAIRVNRGRRVQVGEVVFEGNRAISDRTLRGRMKDTQARTWWRFWGSKPYREDGLDRDLNRITSLYNERGYYDARVTRDTVTVSRDGGRPEAIVRINVAEGPQYHVRNVVWDGNTVYTDEQLTRALGLETGSVFNTRRLEENLYGNKTQSDIAGLYYNRGHMRFNIEPQVQIARGDSVDLVFDVFEGDVYRFGTITIAGNDKTKEHVIRRELYSVPGQTFSRDAITESIRRLSQLNYFNQQALAQGIQQEVNDEAKTVDMMYTVEEVGGDQLELSGTYGYIGLILQLRVTFNNFSAQNLFNREAYRPLPMGDGQQLSVAVQTSGLAYQNYSLSFTEPWFRGKPTPIGFATSFSRIDFDRYSRYGASDTTSGGFNGYSVGSLRGFLNRRLVWPDDKFDASTGLSYRYYYVGQRTNIGLPTGTNHELTAELGLTRNSQDSPIFPRSGSTLALTLDLAPPLPGFIQYHKWGLKTGWNTPLSEKVTFGFSTQYGYIGSFTGDDVRFQRYLIGGSPFDYQGINATFGKDIVYLRGYPSDVIGPRRTDVAVGGRILNKYTSELRWQAVSSPQLQAAPYLFADAGNTWDGFGSFNPAQLYRAAGVGARLFLPILGMIELTYGYNFDRFPAVSGDEDGANKWRFQFSIGQGFNQ